MNLIVVNASAPDLSLADAKRHLRVDTSADDSLIERLILAATEFVEREARVSLRETELLLAADGFPAGALLLPRQPLIEVEAVSYDDPAGISHTLAPESYRVDTLARPGLIEPLAPWPQTSGGATCVRVHYWSGPQNNVIPETLRHAVLLVLGHFYEHREAASDRRIDSIPLGVEALVNQHVCPEVI